MSRRARVYLLVAGSRHLATAAVVLTFPDIFLSPAFDQIRLVLPLWAWAVGFLVTGAACTGAAVGGMRALARGGLSASAVASVVWGVGFLMAAAVSLHLDQPPAGLVGAVWCLHMAGKDAVVASNPMRTPLEDLLAHEAED